MRKQNLFKKVIAVFLMTSFFICPALGPVASAGFYYSTTCSKNSDSLRPLPVEERTEAPEPDASTTRRGFLGKAATGFVGLTGLGWLLGGGTPRVVASGPQFTIDEKLRGQVRVYVAEPCTKFVAGQKITTSGRFKGLHVSYVNLPKRSKNPAGKSDADYIAKYGRTWASYDSSLGGFAELASGNLVAAKETAEGLINLGKMEEERGFKGLWHFSYNTSGDAFIDPRGPFGANCWGLKFILACMLTMKSDRAWVEAHLDWVNRKIKEYVFGQQVLDERDGRYGLFRFGLYNPDDFAKGDDMGYGVWKGNLNAQMQDVSIEHNADAIDVLRLAALVNKEFRAKQEAEFLKELNERHKLVMQSLEKLWRGDHYVTGMNARGVVNESVAVDNNTWVASAILPYDEEKAWKCIQYTRDNIMTTLPLREFEDVPDNVQAILRRQYGDRYGDIQFTGLFFFKRGFKDSVITQPLGKDVELMLQPEATYGFIHLLYQFSLKTKDEAKRREAQELCAKLVDSMMRLQYCIYEGTLPYATKRKQELFNTLPAMAANATAAAVTLELLKGELNPYFLGVTSPVEFEIKGKVTVKPTPAPEKEQPPSLPEEMRKEKPPVKKETPVKEAPKEADKIKMEGIKVTPNSVEFKVVGAPKGAVATGWVQTDIWYIQPQAESTFEITDPKGETIKVDNPRGNFANGKTMIIIFKSEGAFKKMDKTMLRQWEVEGDDIKEHILRIIIIDEDGKPKEISMAEFMEKVRFVRVNEDINGKQTLQLAIDAFLIEGANLTRQMPTPPLSTAYVGMGFLLGGPRGVELGMKQYEPPIRLVDADTGYVRYIEERPTETMTAAVVAPVSPAALEALGAVALQLAQAGGSI